MLKILDSVLKPKFYEPTRDGGNLLDRALIGFTMNNLIVLYDGKVDTYIKKGYQGNAMVYSIITKLAEKRKEAQLNVMKRKGSSKGKYKAFKYSASVENLAKSRLYQKKELDFVPDSDPLAKLMKNPNDTQNTDQFIEDLSKWWDISGEFFIYGFRPEGGLNKGKVTKMYALPCHLVELIQGDIMTPIRGYKLMIGDQSIVFPPEDILHVKTFNPDWNIIGTQLRGQPPLMAGLNLLQKNNAGVQSAMRNNENDGAKGVLSPDGRADINTLLTSTQLADLKQKIEENVNGLKNKAKVVPSGLPMQYTQIGMSPVAMDLIKGLEYDDEKLCGLWGVNPVLFRPNATNANLLHAQKSLVTDCCLPFLNMLEKALTEWLGKDYGTDYVLDFDSQSYAELQPDIKSVLDSYGKSPYYTGNEVRTLTGHDESQDPSMNIHWFSSSLIHASEAMANPDFGDFDATP